MSTGMYCVTILCDMLENLESESVQRVKGRPRFLEPFTHHVSACSVHRSSCTLQTRAAHLYLRRCTSATQSGTLYFFDISSANLVDLTIQSTQSSKEPSPSVRRLTPKICLSILRCVVLINFSRDFVKVHETQPYKREGCTTLMKSCTLFARS